jgi:hypothetical protein
MDNNLALAQTSTHLNSHRWYYLSKVMLMCGCVVEEPY